ncbi:MAG: glycosyltransferase [Actinomycetota bacterium]|nr:glycosyltransferase [Actinomycetota bacterium]
MPQPESAGATCCPAPVQRIGVVVPAKNEADLILGCLEALALACTSVDVAVTVSVVLDDCTDATPDLVAGAAATLGLDLHHREIRSSSVGTARLLGMTDAVARLGVDGTWLATTDADSVVPPDWLNLQVRYAEAGANVVAGTVAVEDWSERPAALRRRAEAHYRRRHGRHVHGANLGLRAESYLAVGGFAAVDCDEDVALVAALARAGEPIVWPDDLTVTTSSRRVSRAPSGFAAYLDRLEATEWPHLARLRVASPTAPAIAPTGSTPLPAAST